MISTIDRILLIQNESRQTKRLIYIIILTGILIRLVQYLVNRSYWLDECHLVVNIVERSYSQLFQPLLENQSAPILFLLIEKTSFLLFGNSEYSLRLFPLITSILSVPLFFRVSKFITGNTTTSTIALGMFALSPTLIYYSSELKQYPIDLFIILVIFNLISFKSNTKTKEVLLYSMVGVIAIAVSNIAIIGLVTIGSYLIVNDLSQKGKISIQTIIITGIWFFSFLLYYFFFIYQHPLQEFMINFHKRHFPPSISPTEELYSWLKWKSDQVFTVLLSFPKGIIVKHVFQIAYLASFFILLLRRRYKVVLLLFLPLVIQIILTWLVIYPFDTRLILYLVPFMLISISLSLVEVSLIFDNKGYKLLGIILFGVAPSVMFGYKLMEKFPIYTEEIRDNLEFISSHIEPDQKIYVYYGAKEAFLFYQNYRDFNFDNEIIHGTVHRGKNELYMTDFEELEGDVWLVFSHVYESIKYPIEERFIVSQLLERGKILDENHSYGSSAYLFSLQPKND